MLTHASLQAALGTQPLAAVQIRDGSDHYNKDLGRWQETLWVDVIVAAPGWHSSRYQQRTLERLHDPDRDQIRATVTAFAAQAGVPVHTVGPQDKADWIALQPPGPTMAWEISWEATRWRSDGHRFQDADTERFTARSGDGALQTACEAVSARLLGSDRGQVRLGATLTLGGESRSRWHTTPTLRPAALPTNQALHRLALGGARPSELFAPPPDTTPLELMWALADAFSLSLDEVAPIGAWRRGDCSAEEADAHLSPRIQQREHRWGLGWLLASAWSRQEPMRRVMLGYKAQGVGPLEMILGLREAFRLPLSHSKTIIDLCCSPNTTDAVFEAHFRDYIRETSA